MPIIEPQDLGFGPPAFDELRAICASDDVRKMGLVINLRTLGVVGPEPIFILEAGFDQEWFHAEATPLRIGTREDVSAFAVAWIKAGLALGAFDWSRP